MRIPKLSVPVIIAILSVALAVGAVVYAFTVDTEPRDTGSISVEGEATDIEVKTYHFDPDTNATTEVIDGSWCEATDLQPGDTTFCLVSLENLKTSTQVNVSQTTGNVDNADALGFADSILVRMDTGGEPASTCDKTANGGIIEDVPLSSLPGFGDPIEGTQAGDLVIDPAQFFYLCYRLEHDATAPVFNATTSATLTFHADDEGF